MNHNFALWNSHPRACVLLVGDDYDQTNEVHRVKAQMAAMLANVWIHNAMVRARKNWPMGWKSVNMNHVSTQPLSYPNFRCVAIQIQCDKCGAAEVGLIGGLCFACRPKDTKPEFLPPGVIKISKSAPISVKWFMTCSLCGTDKGLLHQTPTHAICMECYKGQRP